MRPTSSQFTNPSGLIDKRLGKNFEAVEYVRENLDKVSHLSYYMEGLFNLDRNLTLLSDENVDHHILKDITIFQGPSAYELALKHGFVGTEEEWLASLKGLAGDQGPPGIIDTITLNGILEAITGMSDSLAAANLLISQNADNFSNYATTVAVDTVTANFNGALAALEGDIVSQLGAVVASIPSNSEIIDIAQGAVDASLLAVDAAIDAANVRIDGANALLDTLRGDLDDGTTAFNAFLLQNDDTILRLTALEALSGDNYASIIDLDTVTAEVAARQTILQAQSATHNSSIYDLQQVTADSASQINILQLSNNEQTAAITNVQSIQDGIITDLSALTLEVDSNFTYATNTRTITDGHATQLSALGVRTDDAEAGIIDLQTITADTASDLTALEVRTGDAENSIVNLLTVTSSTTNSLNQLAVRVGSTEGEITTLQSIKADQSSLSIETARIDALTSRTENSESAILSLETTKADQVNLDAEALKISALTSRVRSITPPGIAANVTGSIEFHKNMTASGSNSGEVLITAGSLEHEDLSTHVNISEEVLNTSLEGTLNIPGDEPFYIMWSLSDASSRFSGVTTEQFVIVFYNPLSEEWNYLKSNSVLSSVFTPLTSDRLVAVGHKKAGDVEISEIHSLVGFTNVSSSIEDINITKADKTELYSTASAIAQDRIAAEAAANVATQAETNSVNIESGLNSLAAQVSADKNSVVEARDDVLKERALSLPSTFINGREDFQSSFYSPPGSGAVLNSAWLEHSEAGVPSLKLNSIGEHGGSSYPAITHKTMFTPLDEAKYRLKVTYMLKGSDPVTHPALFSFGFLLTDANSAYQPGNTRGWVSESSSQSLGVWITSYSPVIEASPGDPGWRAAIEVHNQHTTSTEFIIRDFEIQNITTSEEAKNYATAAAQSKLDIDVLKTDIEQSASVVSSDKLLVDTARTEAVQARDTSISVRDDILSQQVLIEESAELTAKLALEVSDFVGDPLLSDPTRSIVYFVGNSGPWNLDPSIIRDHILTKAPNKGASVGARGSVAEITETQRVWAYSSKIYPVDTSKRYEIRARLKQTSLASGGTNAYLGVATFDQNGDAISSGPGTHRYAGGVRPLTINQWEEFSGIITGEGDSNHSQFRPGTAFVRLALVLQDPDGNGTVVIDELSIEDVETREYVDSQAAITTANAVSTSQDASTTNQNVTLTSNYAADALAHRNEASNQATLATNAATLTSSDRAAVSQDRVLSASILKDVVINGHDPYFNNSDLFWVGSGPVLTHKRPLASAKGGVVMAAQGPGTVFADEFIPVDTTKKYRVKLKVRQSVINGAVGFYAGLDCYDANKNRIPGNGGTYAYVAANNLFLGSSWSEFENVVTGELDNYSSFRPGTKYVRRVALPNYNGGSGEVEFDEFSFVDADSAEEAKTYAAQTQNDSVQTGLDAAQTTQDRLAVSVFKDQTEGFKDISLAQASIAQNAATQTTADRAEVSNNAILTAAYSNSVLLERAKMLPSTFENGREDFQSSYYETPATTNALQPDWVSHVENGSFTLALKNIHTLSGYRHLTTKGGSFVPKEGHRYRLEVTYKVTSTPNYPWAFHFGFLLTDANSTYQAGNTRGWTNQPSSSGTVGSWVTAQSSIAVGSAADAGWRPALEINVGAHTADFDLIIRNFKIVDVTQEELAREQAVIATNQAASASLDAAEAAFERSLTAGIRASTLNMLGDPLMVNPEESMVYWVNSSGYYGENEENIGAKPGALRPSKGVSSGSRGSVAVIDSTAQSWCYTVAMFPVNPSKKYKIKGRFKQSELASGNARVYTGIVTYAADRSLISGGAGTHRYRGLANFTPTVGQWHEFEGEYQGEGSTHDTFRPGTAFVRIVFICNYVDGDGVVHLDELRLVEAEEVELLAKVQTNETAIVGVNGQMAALNSDVSTANGNASLALTTAQNNAGDLQSTVSFGVTAGSGGRVELLANNDGSKLTLDVDEVIANGSISANKMSVSTLSALTANVGVLRTATTGQRLEIRSDKIVVYDNNNTVRVKIGNLN